MQVRGLGLGGVAEIVPRKFGDARGFFAETWSKRGFAAMGLDFDWVQDNQSFSAEKGTLRGLHFQVAPFAQDKLIRVLRGSLFDVAVDIRPGSATLGRWVSCVLSAAAFNQLLIPRGFAHGFLTLEPGTEVHYKVSAPYSAECDRSIRYDDPAFAIAWPLAGQTPVVSDKDAGAPLHAEIAASIRF